jgi:hypothetical protein
MLKKKKPYRQNYRAFGIARIISVESMEYIKELTMTI